MNAAAQRVLATLPNARHTHDGWQDRCPVCGGSLTVRETRGMPRVQCEHDCQVDDIRTRLGLTLEDMVLHPGEPFEDPTPLPARRLELISDTRPSGNHASDQRHDGPAPAPTPAPPKPPTPSTSASRPAAAAAREPSSGLFPAAWDDADAPEEIKKLNHEYAVVVEGGRAMVWRPCWEGGRIVYERLGERDFQLLKKNQTAEVVVDFESKGEEIVPKTKKLPLGKYWLEHPKRRTYERVIFEPTPGFITPPGTLNVWRGFAVQPAPGQWNRFDAFLREVICGGNDEAYRYLRRWLARTLQRPDLRGEVAVVLRGLKGVGKGTLGNTLVLIFGQHGLHISNSRYLVGNFNSHLRDLGFLFVDEAFWAGDKQGESVLKSLITEPHQMIEPKYQNAFQAPNRLSILMASNAEWVVPASLQGERRYFVLDVADTHVGDHAYFTAIHAELEAGGLAAFLHDMLAEDLTGFNHRDVPSTGALEQQIIQSMDPMDEWWYERLSQGTPLGPDAPFGEVTGDWATGQVMVTKQALHDDFIRFCERHRYPAKGGHATQVKLGIRLRKRLPAGWPRDEWTSGSRSGAAYSVPSVSECRRAFSRGRDGLFAAEDDEPSF